MSRVDRIAERLKFARLLRLSDDELAPFDSLDAPTMRALRARISDALHEESEDEGGFDDGHGHEDDGHGMQQCADRCGRNHGCR